MHYYFVILGTVAGLCLGFGIMYLFIVLRRKEDKRLNLTFSLFALCYAGTLLDAVRWYSATSVAQFVSASRWDAVFVVTAFVALVWYVAFYTGVRPQVFLWALTIAFILPGIAQIVRPTMIHQEILGLSYIILPWGERLSSLEATDSFWSLLFVFARLATLGFILFACFRQYRRGERRAAIVLGAGMVWFVATIVFEILGESGIVPYFPMGEFGFLAIALVMSLQMANTTIKTEQELAAYRLNLEEMVTTRTAELEAAQAQLLAQAQEEAVAAERSRLAHDLHDVVTQILFSVNLIAISLPRLWKRDPDMAERSTNELQRLTRGALAEMRTLLRELRPHTIAATELGTLLTQLSDGVAARHDIPANVNVGRICELPPEVHVVLYRIAQEAMNNIAKHAEASHLAVNLACGETAVHLTINDDGQGFDVNNVSPARMGLDIMRERSGAIGADLTIDSQPGAGTTISVVWTLPQTGEGTNE